MLDVRGGVNPKSITSSTEKESTADYVRLGNTDCVDHVTYDMGEIIQIEQICNPFPINYT